MAVTYGFYNALNHDRLYDAIQMSSIFDGIIRDGIFSTIGTSMVVTAPEDGLYVNVGPGRAWFNHTWTLNDTEYPVEAEEAEVVLDRIDAVILEVNSAAEVRANSIKFLKGTPASEPVKPTLTHNAEVNQYALAYVRIRAGQTTIFQADVENVVGTDETPFVTGLMQQVSIENLILQWEAEFDDHFETWRNINEAEFEVWSQEMQDEYNAWILNQVNTYQTWFAGIQAEAGDDIDEVMAWFEHMKGQVSEDAAIHLQEEIDELAESAEKGSVVTVHTINQTLYGKNCVISQDGQSRTARFDNTGTAVFESIPYVGQVTVTATDGTLTAVTYLTIPYFGRYSTNLAFWAATVNISTQSPEFFSLPIKIFKDNVLIETISFSALGSATYIATSEGTYKFSVTYDNADFDHTIVIDEETTYTVVINDWNATLNMQTSVSELYGRGITISKGGVTVGTTTFNGSGHATYKVHEPGTYHIVTSTAGGDTYSADVVVTEETAYPVDLGLPNGSTVLPTDDINDKSYTTLAEVLEDSVTFNALLGDSNACDYMARSTTWAGKGEGLVPTMTSATTPSGECFGSSYEQGGVAYKAFDGDPSTFFLPARNTTPEYVGYTFTSATLVRYAILTLKEEGGADTSDVVVKIQGSNDGFVSDVNTLATQTITLSNASGASTSYGILVNAENAYTSYRLYTDDMFFKTSSPTRCYGLELQFYADAEGICDDSQAMSILGRYDYACEAVLANEDWAEAIGNSDYFESVLDVKVPVMTSDTTPSGVASVSSVYGSSFAAWMAFNPSNANGWVPLSSDRPNPYIQYMFTSPVVISVVKTHWVSGAITKTYKISGSNDGTNWADIGTDYSLVNDVESTEIFNNTTAYKYYRLTFTNSPTGYYTDGQGIKLQFYGRHSSQNLVPLVPTMTSNTTPSGECSASSEVSGHEAYKGFGNGIWEATTTGGSSGSPSIGWLQYQFTSAKIVTKATFNVNSGSSQYPNYCYRYIVSGSNDGSEWTELVNETYDGNVANPSIETTFSNSTAYLYYRLTVHTGAASNVSSPSVVGTQFYGPAPTSVIHSVPNDTIYYYDEGVETTLCTCDSNGVGEVDWSDLPQGLITLYSTTAKDILNNHASNDFSMNIRVTPNKVDAWLIPENDNIVYWFGYTKNSLGAKVNTSLNTNTITVSGAGSCAFDKAFDASKFTKMCMYGTGGNNGAHWCMGLAFTSPTSVSSSTRIGGGMSITDELKIHTQTISTTGNVYLGTYVESAAPTEVIYALWAEEAA